MARPVEEGKAFQEVNSWGQPSSSTLSQPQKCSILAGGRGCVGVSQVFSHTGITDFRASHTGPGSCSENLLYSVPRPGIPLELQVGWPCVPVSPQVDSLNKTVWFPKGNKSTCMPGMAAHKHV